MRLVVVDCGSPRVPYLETVLRGFGAAVSRVALAKADPGVFRDTDAVVISGGPHLFTGPDGDALIDRFAFIDRLTAPILGICLGHQAIGLRCGASVYRGAPRRTVEPIEILAPHPLIGPLGDRVEFQADHCEGITQPPGFEIIARSAHYANEVMVCDPLRRYGVQAHPESSGEHGRALLAAFVKLAACTVS